MRGLTRQQWILLLVLAGINFLNYLDRQVIFPLFHSIQLEFHINDFQLGLLGTMFMLVHSLTSIPLGILADRLSRRLVIATGVMFWSVMSFASGLTRSFRALLGVRSLVGIGEASYAPAATAILADNFPANIRARVQGIFYSGMFFGGTIGVVIGGLVVYHTGNWRLAFFIASIPGFILALLSFWLPDHRSPAQGQHPWRIGYVFQNPAYVWILISGTFGAFAAGGFIAWGIEFVRRFKGYTLRDASLTLGITLMVAGVVGVLLGSIIADKWQERKRWGRSMVIALALIVSGPLLYWGLAMDARGGAFLAVFFFGTMLASFFHAPVSAVINDLMPSSVRATAFGVYLFVIHILGDTTAPAVIGHISDAYNLRFGLELLALFVFLGGITFLPVVYLIHTQRVVLYVDDDAQVS